MKKILVVCHLDKSSTSGQEAKTNDIIEVLKNNGYCVSIFNYGCMSMFKRIFLFLKRIKTNETIILMPGGRRALSLYCHLLFPFLNKKNIHYVVVGGWVSDYYLEGHSSRTFKFLRKINGIYLQNQKAVSEFEERGFTNCYCVPTFSSRKPLTFYEFEQSCRKIKEQHEFRYLYFARVSENKGVLNACYAISEIQKKTSR